MPRPTSWLVPVLFLISPAAVGAVDLQPLVRSGPYLATPTTPTLPYTAPKADGPVVVLLDEGSEPLFPLLDNAAAGESGTVAREDRDVFAGVEAVRVTPLQKYQPHIPGWAFRIVETPKVAGEFRYLRFAWKKFGGSGVMIQLHDSVKQGWGLRYFAGENTAGWVSKSVGGTMPTGWEVVTRDLYKDFGTTTISGLALTAMNGESALFDHILLGRSVEDLDRATDEALGRLKPAKPLAGKERDALWEDLCGPDQKKAAAGLRGFLATAPDQVGYIRERLPKPDPAISNRVRKLIADFESDDFDTRQNAAEELVKIGAPAVEAVREAGAKSNSDEVKYRSEWVLKRVAGPGSGSPTSHMSRVIRVLERAGSPAAQDVLTRLADGEYGTEFAADARAALGRMGNKR